MRPTLRLASFCASLCWMLAASIPAQGTGALPVPSLEVSGVVLDGGRPVAGAEVFVLRPELPLPGAQAHSGQRYRTETLASDAEGRFRFEVAPWRRAAIWARKDGRVSAFVEAIDPLRQGEPLRLELAEGKPVQAELRHRRRAPGTEIAYRLTRVPEAADGVVVHFEGQIGADGRLETQPLPSGRYQLRLAAAKLRLLRPTLLEPGTSQELALGRAIALQGRIQSGDGLMARPLAGVVVELLDEMSFGEATSAVDGTFTLEGLEEGPGATLLLRPDPALGPTQRDIQALLPGLSPRDAAPQFEITLPAGRVAQGRILDADDRPAAGVQVLARCFMHTRGISEADLSVSAVTDGEGRYELRGLQGEAAYDVIALGQNGDPQMIARIDPAAQLQAVRLGDFVLGSHRIEGRVALDDGIDSTKVELRIYGPKDHGEFGSFRRLVPFEGGRYLSPSVPVGEYVVFAVSPESGFARGLARIRQNEGAAPVPCKITFSRPRELKGSVVDANNNPVANATITLLPSGGTPDGGFREWHDFVASQLFADLYPGKEYVGSVRTDAQGRYSITCYEASGSYDLYVTAPGRSGGAEQDGGQRVAGVLGRQNPIGIQLQ